MKSRLRWSASTASSITLRITCACDSGDSSAARLTSPKVSRPSSNWLDIVHRRKLLVRTPQLLARGSRDGNPIGRHPGTGVDVARERISVSGGGSCGLRALQLEDVPVGLGDGALVRRHPGRFA